MKRLSLQSLNAQSRALLMQKLDRTGIATRFVFIILHWFQIIISCSCFWLFLFWQYCGVTWSSSAEWVSTKSTCWYFADQWSSGSLCSNSSGYSYAVCSHRTHWKPQWMSTIKEYVWSSHWGLCSLLKIVLLSFEEKKIILKFNIILQREPDFDIDIKDDVEEECSKCGRVKHIYVDK